MNPEQIEEVVPKIMDYDPDFVVLSAPTLEHQVQPEQENYSLKWMYQP